MKPRLRVLMALAAIVAAIGISTAWAAPASVVLPVPFRSQFDGSAWGESNCGPTAISMVLQAFGQNIPTQALRDRANQLLGIADPNTGTRIQDLAQVVREHGLTVTGPYTTPGSMRKWTADDVRAELQAGHPVIAQLNYALMPNHMDRPVATDHYVAIVGFSGDNFIFNDSADYWGPGYRQTMTTAELNRAWGTSQAPFGGFSVGPGSDGVSLLPPPATTASAPAPAAAPTPTATATPAANGSPAQPSQVASTAAPTASNAPAAPASQGTASKPAAANTTPQTQQKDNSQPKAPAASAPAQDQSSKSQAAPATPAPLPNLSGLLDRIRSNVQASSK